MQKKKKEDQYPWNSQNLFPNKTKLSSNKLTKVIRE